MGGLLRTLIPSVGLALLWAGSGPALVAVSAPAPAAAPIAAVETPTAEQAQFFETKIRPVLTEKCFPCHSSRGEKIKGGLVLENRAGVLRGGDDGAVVVPGDVNASLLIRAIRYEDPK